MAETIPQSVTKRVPLQAYLSSDHISPATGKTIVITISKNGAAYANPSGGATNAVEISSGSYYVDLTITDTATLGPLFVLGTCAGVDQLVAIYSVANANTLGAAALPNTACTTNASLLTSGTGTDQLSVSAGKVLLQATQTGVTIPTVTTVTNQLTAAAIATGVWTDTISGDFTTISSIGRALYTANAPGGATGLAIVGSNMGTVTSVTAAVTLPSIPSNWITAAGIASGALVAAVWDGAISGHTSAGTFGAALNAASSAGDPWQTALPGTYSAGQAGFIVGTNLNATVSSRLPTSSYTSPLTSAQTASVVWQDTTAGDFTVAGSIGRSLFTSGNLPGASSGLALVGSNMGTVSSVSGAVGSVTGSVGSVAGNVAGNVLGSVGSIATGGIVNASFAADTGKQTIRSGTCQAGSTSSTIKLDSGASATDHLYDGVGVFLTGGTGVGQYRLGRNDYSGSGKTLTVTPAWTTTPDGTTTFALLPSSSTWDQVVADHTISGSLGNAVGTNLDVAVSTRMATFSLPPNFVALSITGLGAVTFANTSIGTVTTLTNLPAIPNNWLTSAGIASGALIAAVWDGTISGHTTGGTFGGALNSAASAGDPWQTLIPGAYTAGQAGNIVGNLLDVAVSSRMATFSLPTNFSSLTISGGSGAVTFSNTTIATVTNLTNLPSIPNNWLTAAGIASGALIAAVWDGSISGHTTGGTFGGVLNAAASAGDPWQTLLPGGYTAGQAGYIIGNNIDAATSSRLATVGYTAPPTAAQNATAVWTDTTGSDFATTSSPGKILVSQLGGTFTTTSSSIFSGVSLVNAPTGGSAPTVGQIATAVWQDLAASSDFTVTGSIGKLLVSNVPQTGDSFARIGSSGSGLTSLAQAATALSLTTAVPINNTANTLGDCLNAARAQGFGQWTIVGTVLTLYAPDGFTPVRNFILDSATPPITSRT